ATIPITGACSQAVCGTYGGQIQDDVSMTAKSTVTLSLTSTEGIALSSLSLNPAGVTGGTSVTGTVNLSGPAPADGVSIALSSDNASANVANAVIIAAGSSSATFTVSTNSVASAASATITANYGGSSKTALLTITPSAGVTLSSVAVNPASV